MQSNLVKEYIQWFVKQVRHIQTQTQPNSIYKIVGKRKCKRTGEEQLVIQMAGKNVFAYRSPQKLVQDEATLKGFSPLDVRTITYLACQLENPAKEKPSLYRIIAQFFSRNRKEEMFVLEAKDKAMQITQTAQEISSNQELISKLDPQDAHRIGYVTGVEQTIAEEEVLRSERDKKISAGN